MKKKILIIEDEYDLACMIKKYLVREHYDVALVDHGELAISTFEAFQPDMILLDIMLPGKDGLEILRQVRVLSTIPVIITSAKETELDRILGLKVGADDYLIKPFSIKELVARVEAIFRRIEHYSSKENIKRVLKYNQLELALSSREISKEGEIVWFTTKEFDLLFFLLQHPKQVLHKSQIYDHVWGSNEYGDINTVAIHIQKIREKLGDGHAITTVRGIGYRFDGTLE